MLARATTLAAPRRALATALLAVGLAALPACKDRGPSPAGTSPKPGSKPAPAPTRGQAAPATQPAPGPVSALAGKDLDQIRRLLRPGQASPRLLRGVATFLDDQEGGDDERIDPGPEALHLATFLATVAPDALQERHRPSQAEIERYRARVVPRSRSATKLASDLHYDVDGLDLAQKSHHERTAKYWKPHFDRNKKQIMRAVRIMKRRRGDRAGRPRVMALGAGSCADIPLAEIVAAGCDVVLVDLDEASLKKGVAMQLTPAQRRHVQLQVRDLTEGAVDAITAKARRIIRQHALAGNPPARARAALGALFRQQRASVPMLEGGYRVDLLISSLLIGQLPVFPAKTIGRWFSRKLGEPLVQSNDDMLAQSEFGDQLFDAHIEALADFVVRQRGVVYFSSDLYLMPSLYEADSGKVRYGSPRPVMGFRGRPLPDLDVAFADIPALRVISQSKGNQPGSDFWVWDQEPAQLAPNVRTFKLRTRTGVEEVTGKRGMARAVDAVILVPAADRAPAASPAR